MHIQRISAIAYSVLVCLFIQCFLSAICLLCISRENLQLHILSAGVSFYPLLSLYSLFAYENAYPEKFYPANSTHKYICFCSANMNKQTNLSNYLPLRLRGLVCVSVCMRLTVCVFCVFTSVCFCDCFCWVTGKHTVCSYSKDK